MNAYKLLEQDHEAVADTFEQLESTTEGALKTREALFAKLNFELGVHAAIEETIFYPARRDAAETHDIVLEAVEEHQIVKDLLAELDSMPKDTDEWSAKLRVLKENVDHHLDEEEGDLFKKAKKVLTSEQADQLGKRLQEAKGQIAAKARASR